ncbi:MAG TPA: alpha-glucosidase C-terminal domain-containing protein, partial [Candidatus Saccharimonadales bacterium]|nr:alpha-glucosidase C-terminal domain-containing protein [Candidatus Saccharimonadales bacterium]
GVRTPMQWSADRNAGFSTANRQALYFPVVTDPEYHYEAVNVEIQQANPQSLLWWMKRLIALRRQYPAFGRGTLDFLAPDNRKVLAFLRRLGAEQILVVANLSRFSQPVELNLSAFVGLIPIEMFGRVEFPAISSLPYFLTVAPHGFYWLSLEQPAVTRTSATPAELPRLRSRGSWEAWLRTEAVGQLGRVLPRYLRQRRWFRGKARHITSTTLGDVIQVRGNERLAAIALVAVGYADGDPETYVLPLQLAHGDEAQRIQADAAHAVIARFVVGETGAEGVLYDAVADPGFDSVLLDAIASRRRFRGRTDEIVGTPARGGKELLGDAPGFLAASVARGEQSNSSIVFGDRLILKLFRTLESGINPDLEMTRFLADHAFPHVPRVAGWLSHRPEDRRPAARGEAARGPAARGHASGEQATVGILQEFVTNEGDLWRVTLNALSVYLDRAAAESGPPPPVVTSIRGLVGLATEEPTAPAHRMLDPYLDAVWLLGTRTGELHLSLASDPDDAAFSAQPFTPQDQRSLYQSLHNQLRQVFLTLSRATPSLPEATRAQARAVLAAQDGIEARYRAVLQGRLTAQRIRVHGDYHLGQVLWTGRDVVIIDFEGEPTRPLGERRRKRSALVDIAGMLRSFHYAAYGALVDPALRGPVRVEDVAALEPWIATWYAWVAATFLRGYREAVGDARFMPRSEEELERLLDAFVLEKAVFEIGYELNNRPDWIAIPLRGVTELVGG